MFRLPSARRGLLWPFSGPSRVSKKGCCGVDQHVKACEKWLCNHQPWVAGVSCHSSFPGPCCDGCSKVRKAGACTQRGLLLTLLHEPWKSLSSDPNPTLPKTVVALPPESCARAPGEAAVHPADSQTFTNEGECIARMAFALAKS